MPQILAGLGRQDCVHTKIRDCPRTPNPTLRDRSFLTADKTGNCWVRWGSWHLVYFWHVSTWCHQPGRVGPAMCPVAPWVVIVSGAGWGRGRKGHNRSCPSNSYWPAKCIGFQGSCCATRKDTVSTSQKSQVVPQCKGTFFWELQGGSLSLKLGTVMLMSLWPWGINELMSVKAANPSDDQRHTDVESFYFPPVTWSLRHHTLL